MKKLFKEVWKSFSKSKIILAGLIVLIFLTSGIITLIFDVYKSYTSRYDTYKKQSVLQDVTMNSSFNLYGEYPSDMYQKSIENIYEYKENKNNYVDYIQINLDPKQELFKLDNSFVPSLTNSIYVKAKDLSELLNTNLNIGQIPNVNNGQNVNVKLNPTGNNFLFYYSNPQNSKPDEITKLNGIYDTYDKQSKAWSKSYDSKNLINYKLGSFSSFKSLVIDNETHNAYVKDILVKSNSFEGQKYNNNKNVFTELDSNYVAKLLGFNQNNEIEKESNWILDGNINDYVGQDAKTFFKETNKILTIKGEFELLGSVSLINKIEIKEFNIPTRWLVYSQYNYIFKKETWNLNNLSSGKWTGFYKDYIQYLSDKNLLDKYETTSFWTKDIIVNKVDYTGNVIELVNADNQILPDTKQQTKFNNVILTNSDLTLPIKKQGDNSNTTTTIATLSNLANISSNSASELSRNRTVELADEIKNNAKYWKDQHIIDDFKKLSKQMGIRETLTVNSNDENRTNVYQFINLGNKENEINWNGIDVKQEVGKLIDTDKSNPIFSLPSSIDHEVQKIPIEYVPNILDKLLRGLSLNRDYINPMISFNDLSISTPPQGDQTTPQVTKLGTLKIVWINKDGDFNNKEIYGVSAIRDEDQMSNKKTYYVFKLASKLGEEAILWRYVTTFSTYEEFAKYIIDNNFNFAPIDINGNPLQIIGKKGWVRQDSTYKDKYSVPFQYLLPSSDIIKAFNDAQRPDYTGDKQGMEIFRDNLINSLTLSIRPLLPATLWEKLMNGVNIAFSKYGFGAGLTPPAAVPVHALVKVVMGVFRDATIRTSDALVGPVFANILDGIKRSFNQDGTTDIAQQKIIFNQQMKLISKILALTLGINLDLSFINDLIKNPSNLLDGLKSLISSINLDQAVVDIWNNFYGKDESITRTLGTGDFVPYIYKNIYSIDVFKNSIKKILNATTIGEMKVTDLLQMLVDKGIINIPSNVIGMIGNVIKNSTVSGIMDLISMQDPETGYKNLINSVYEDTFVVNGHTFTTKSILLKNIMSLFVISIKDPWLGIIPSKLNLGTLIPKEVKTNIIYDGLKSVPLELDMDMLWYFNNYVFTLNKQTRNETTESMKLFGVDISYFIDHATSSFTEIKDDYNMITMTENSGKIAIVNSAFLEQNNKKVYSSNDLNKDIEDMEKISDEYKININNVEYLIVGSDFSVDYMYPVINAENITVNTKTQALVYVNQFGFDRIKRSFPNSAYENYFLFTAKDNSSPQQLQTELNKYVYKLITGTDYKGSNINNERDNINKLAYLTTETSLVNPERALRITVIDQMINNLENVRLIVGILLIVITAIVISFVIRRYIASRSKVLGILQAQGYSSLQIAGALCLFPLFVSVIGATLGYVAGLTSQYGIYKLLSIFWTMSISTVPFNWITFTVTLLAPIIGLCLLTTLITLWFLHKNKPLSMMNGSMEVNDTKFAHGVNRMMAKTSVKNKFSISLSLGSIGKLIALFISALFTACVTLFAATSYKAFDKAVDKTYVNRDYQYKIQYVTPTYEGGNVAKYYIEPGGANAIDIANSLYVPVGDVNEAYVYFSNYFKPGYVEAINKDNKNGNIDIITANNLPHIFTKASIDLTVKAGGLDINVWRNLYNAIPESQRVSIINSSSKSNKWLEWTQEGKEVEHSGKKYITKFENYGTSNEYLTLWDPNTKSNLQVPSLNDPNKKEDIRVQYFDFVENLNDASNSKFKYNKIKVLNGVETNEYVSNELVILGTESSNIDRASYRSFLVNGYNNMFNYSPTSLNPTNSLLPEEYRVNQNVRPSFELDYFISPGAIFLGTENNVKDSLFTYIEAQNTNNQNIQPTIFGYNPESTQIKVVDSSGNNLLKIAQSLISDNIYPLIVNKVVATKYGLSKGDEMSFSVSNSYYRFNDKLKERINEINQNKDLNIDSNVFKFRIVGISESYINEEWITSQEVANTILKMPTGSFNGSLTKLEKPISLIHSLPLYSYNGYWSADNKIFTSSDIKGLSISERKKIISTYRELFFNPDLQTKENVSLVATWIKQIEKTNLNANGELIVTKPYQDDVKANELIKKITGLQDINLQYIENQDNIESATKANSAINKFIEIYTDNALYASLDNAVSNGIEKEYIQGASGTINDAMTIMLVITFTISLTVLIMITSMIIKENERNIAIFGIMGYSTREKLRMFFSIYVPIVVLSLLLSILVIWLVIPAFLSTILSSSMILLPMGISFVHVLIASGILLFVFAITCMVLWIVQGRVQPIILLKEV